MTTTTQRLYLTTDAPAVAVAPSGVWTGLGTSVAVAAADPRPVSPAVTQTGSAAGTSGQQIRIQSVVGPPLPAGGSLTSVTLMQSYSANGASQQARAVLTARVVSNDGTTVLATIGTVNSALLTTGGVQRWHELTVAGPVDVPAGARVVVDFGAVFTGSRTVQTSSRSYADPDATAADLNTANARVPWIDVVIETVDPPDPPTDLHQSGATTEDVTVSWSPPAGGGPVTSYEYRWDGWGAWNDIGDVLTWSSDGFGPGVTSLFEVRAVGPGGVSAPVGVVTETLTPGTPDRRWWTHRLADALGLDPVNDQPIVQVRTWDGAGFVVDDVLSRALQSYQVTYGRRDPTSRVEALTANLVWATPKLAAGEVATPTVATRLQVALSPAVCTALGIPADAGIRFTGEVTDPTVAHAQRLTAAAAVGRMGRANRIPVDGTGWPVEDDGNRVARILPAAGVGIDVGTIDPGFVNVAAPTRLETVATLLEQVAASSLGQLVEQPSGVVDWHDAEHRRDPVVALTASAAAVLRDVTWTQRLASLVNDLDVKTAAGAVVTVEDTESSDPDRYGPWPGSLDTILTTDVDARALGTDVVGRRADPSWQLPDLTMNLIRTVPIGQLGDVLQLRYGSLIELTDLPVEFPNNGRVFVEGWVESATPRVWSMSLSVSDPLQSGVGIRWIDWPDTDDYQWQDLHLDVSWFDLARIYDPADTI